MTLGDLIDSGEQLFEEQRPTKFRHMRGEPDHPLTVASRFDYEWVLYVPKGVSIHQK